MKKKLSIIIVVKNDIKGIKKTLRSIFSNNLSDIKIIVVDGKSNDGTLEYLQKQKKNIDILKIENDPKGIYSAFNYALKFNDSQFHIFINAGDTLSNFNTRKLIDPCLIPVKMGNRYFKLKSHVFGMPYCHQGMIFKSNINDSFDLNYSISSDFDYFMRKKEEFKNLEIVNNGYAEFDTNGFSSAPSMRIKIVLEESRILFKYTGNIFYLFLHFFYGLISVLRLNFIR